MLSIFLKKNNVTSLFLKKIPESNGLTPSPYPNVAATVYERFIKLIFKFWEINPLFAESANRTLLDEIQRFEFISSFSRFMKIIFDHPIVRTGLCSRLRITAPILMLEKIINLRKMNYIV
jgi:hypothetical protein